MNIIPDDHSGFFFCFQVLHNSPTAAQQRSEELKCFCSFTVYSAPPTTQYKTSEADGRRANHSSECVIQRFKQGNHRNQFTFKTLEKRRKRRTGGGVKEEVEQGGVQASGVEFIACSLTG